MNVQLRSPKEIMKLSRLGCFHQSKLSFLRSFLEEFKDWKYSRDLFELDKDWKHPMSKHHIKNLLLSLPITDINSIKQI